jgi:hypothetical protein
MSPLSLRVADRADRAAIKVYNANEKIGDIHDVVLDLTEGRGRHPLAWTVVAVDYDKAIRRIATAIRDCQKDDPNKSILKREAYGEVHSRSAARCPASGHSN